jgi:energy-coupling factor transporter ATP-binding protein EcfA2
VQVYLENVRSFCGTHTIPVRPLTLLVGENSTGKSTFLAMLSHISAYSFPSLRPSFNEEPFELGTYDSIATYKGGRFGRAHTFSAGLVSDAGRASGSVVASYSSLKGQPQLSTLEAVVKGRKVVLNIDTESLDTKLTFSLKGSHPQTLRFNLKSRAETEAENSLAFLVRSVFYGQNVPKGTRKLFGIAESLLWEILRYSRVNARSVVALAPVRTKPKRTYDVISDEFTPEGDHIPTLLARIFQGEDLARRQRMVEALSEFGAESSLFKRIAVRSLGKRPSDPFQILVSLAGPAANMLDVGYGVSQSLPVIVQSVLAQRSHQPQLLFQQPEVHLHPRGQAALGSFFARLVSKHKMEFVVETHSDHLVDRVRQEVARGTISRNSVLILFFEKNEIETTIHRIKLDKNGNILDAPKSFRQFFLEEETNLLTRTSR